MSYYGRRYPAKPATGTQPAKRKWNGYKAGVKVEPGSTYKPCICMSDEQVSIQNLIVNGTGSVMVEAYAGTGKTTLIVECMYAVKRHSPRTTQAYIVFASRNKEEAIGKCPVGSEVKTAHAFGLHAICKANPGKKVEVDKEKTYRIATALVGPDDDKQELRYMLEKAIDLGKDYLCTDRESVCAMMARQGIEPCSLSEQDFADKVLEGMKVSAQQPLIVSFSDMIWIPLILNYTIPHFDILYTDECQDMNPARIELIMRSIGASGRGMFVGDENQSIFAFTGADRHALHTLKERANAVVMPLHRTFRCGKAIVDAARVYVPDYVAAETNSDGEVRECSLETLMSENGAQAGDFILSRTNAPTVKIAMQFLKQGRKCCIQGKDLGRDLLYMIKRSDAKTVPEFQSWLDSWASAEIERLTAKKRPTDYITDKAECLEAFCEGTGDLGVVKSRISAMFDDTEKNETHRITLSTVHKSKGLERNRVWIIESSFVVRAKTEEDQVQERNVRYVALTRARDMLALVGA